MKAKIISGKDLAQKIRKEISEKVKILQTKDLTPGLAVILVGDDAASQIYVRGKERACQEVGFYSEIHRLPKDTTQEKLLNLIENLNVDPKIHGILVQLPLPPQIDEKFVIDGIIVNKDVDGFHPISNGKLMVGEKGFRPCTPKGCIRLIKETGLDIQGKKAVIIGRSNIVGKPLALMLLEENATVTICHSKTKNLGEITKEADILIAAVGKAHLVTADMVKEGAVVIDVGMNRLEDGHLVGDVDFQNVQEVASWITPVPGGVGPMTIAMLLENTLQGAMETLNG